ncbi:MAG: hypothetical protein AAFR04_06560, partial [Pseudomonadota bacterium]
LEVFEVRGRRAFVQTIGKGKVCGWVDARRLLIGHNSLPYRDLHRGRATALERGLGTHALVLAPVTLRTGPGKSFAKVGSAALKVGFARVYKARKGWLFLAGADPYASEQPAGWVRWSDVHVYGRPRAILVFNKPGVGNLIYENQAAALEKHVGARIARERLRIGPAAVFPIVATIQAWRTPTHEIVLRTGAAPQVRTPARADRPAVASDERKPAVRLARLRRDDENRASTSTLRVFFVRHDDVKAPAAVPALLLTPIEFNAMARVMGQACAFVRQKAADSRVLAKLLDETADSPFSRAPSQPKPTSFTALIERILGVSQSQRLPLLDLTPSAFNKVWRRVQRTKVGSGVRGEVCRTAYLLGLIRQGRYIDASAIEPVGALRSRWQPKVERATRALSLRLEGVGAQDYVIVPEAYLPRAPWQRGP